MTLCHRPFHLRNSIIAVILACASLYTHADIEITSPKQVVQEATSRMTERLLKDHAQLDSQPRYLEHLVDQLLLPSIDHKYMAKRVLAKYWKKTSKQQKTLFIEAFKHKVIRTYAGAFKAFNGQKILFDEARYSKSGKRAAVNTKIQRVGAPPIRVTYKLFDKQGEWLAYDIVIEGVSLVKNFRDQLRQRIADDGLEHTISALTAEYQGQYLDRGSELSMPQPTVIVHD